MKKLTAKSLRAGQTVWYARLKSFDVATFELGRAFLLSDKAPMPPYGELAESYPRKHIRDSVARWGADPGMSYSRRKVLRWIAEYNLREQQ